MAKWRFSARDNGGKYQHFVVSAPDKMTAINKGLERAKRYAAGDIGPHWKCELVRHYGIR